jgi:hypothetical protein
MVTDEAVDVNVSWDTIGQDFYSSGALVVDPASLVAGRYGRDRC